MNYVVRLNEFEGPLDLLLHLIGNAKINIEDIFVSKVTKQYLEYMQQIGELDMDSGSEFLRMAATLIYIKSKSLLPKSPIETEEDEKIEENLILQLKEYSQIKKISEEMRKLENIGVSSFYKLPEEFISPIQLDLEGVDIKTLYDAYIAVLNKGAEDIVKLKPIEIKQEKFKVQDKINYILNELSQNGKLKFSAFLKESTSKIEIAVSFLAVLELLTRGEIKIRQKDYLDEIYISKRSREY